MAKAKSPEDAILDGVRKALGALPHLRPLKKGKGALFSSKQADLADRAVREGYFTTREAAPTGGKSKNPAVVYAVVTETGARKLAEVGGAQDLEGVLKLLHSAVEKLGTPPVPPDPAAFQNTIEKATATCVDAINAAFAKLSAEVLHSVTPAGGAATDPGPILAGITAALGNIKPTVVKVPVITETVPAAIAPVAPVSPPPPVAKPTDTTNSIAGEILAFVGNWTRDKGVGCQFDVLMNHLRHQHPSLTIGNFQDTLRKLYEAERMRLTGWAKMLDELPEPELALFVSSKVMYYAHATERNG